MPKKWSNMMNLTNVRVIIVSENTGVQNSNDIL